MDTSTDNQNLGGNITTDSEMYTDQPAAGTPSSLSSLNMAADGGGPDNNGNSKRKRFVKVVEVDAPNNLDLDAYIANYKGHTKVNRLEFIADRCPALQIDALKLSITELKNTQTLNIPRYANLVKKLNEAVKFGAPGSAGVPSELLNIDKAWADRQFQKAKQQTDLLEGELKNYKRNSIKESIRMGNIELGNHYYACGDLTSAHRAYSRTRDYCTTSKHVVEMCMNIIKVSIELGNFPHVATFVIKAESSPEVAQDKELNKAKLKAASGLAHLDLSKYSVAARDFLSIGEELVGHQFNDVLSANDIAVYGGLCALASFSRAELKRLVLDNVGFRQYLELEPHIRDLIQGFYNSNYAQCLDIMDKWRNDYLLDLHLHSHVEALYTNIRKKALIQFTSPFLTVDLTKMAKSFSTTVPDLEKELVSLIIGGQIEARIDSQQKILWAKQTNKRSAIFDRSTTMGQDYEREAKGLVLRIQMINHGLIVKAPGSAKGGEGDVADAVFEHHHHHPRGGRSGREVPMFTDARANMTNFLSNFSRDRHRG
ncbi:COP9 signalosome complex subunit 1 [Modicella reniformis]|uniref:COP9 signalosome complex subunit 1 n=1 Tax=Modicella reniformis TaxID=1440133 RepID=A0A9P6IXA5_9FUNG|nr:COP9 signalosome complex subunit 1 [Modicella reniformis]